MDSKLKAFVLVAVVASIAVLAVLPADDASADAQVSYLGYDEDLGLSVFSVTTETPYLWVNLTVGGLQGTDGDPTTPATVFHPSIRGDEFIAGTYDYVLTDVDGNEIFAAEVTIGGPSTFSVTYTTNDPSLGTVTTDSTTTGLKTGDKVVLQIAATDGNELTALTANGEDVLAQFDKENGTYTVTIEDEDVAVEATFAAKTTPVDPTPHAITVTVTGIEGVAVDAQVEGVVVKEAVQGKTVKLVPGTYDSDKYSVAYTVNGEAVTGDSFTMPDEDVEVVAAFTEKSTEKTGIAIGETSYATVAEAISAAKQTATAASPVTVTVDTSIADISGSTIELQTNVVVEVSAVKAVTDLTVTYADAVATSTVKAVKLGAGSSVSFEAGSVEITGDVFAGDNGFEVVSGTAVISGTIDKGTSIVVTVDDGAKLQVGDLSVAKTEGKDAKEYFSSSSVQIVAADDAVEFAGTYIGPAILDENGARDKNLSYTEGSRIFFTEGTDEIFENIYHIKSGGIDITVGVADFEIDYQGRVITNEDIETLTARVDSYSDGYRPTSAAIPTFRESVADTLSEPGTTANAIRVFVVGDQSIEGLSRVVYANLTIKDIPTHTITWKNDDGSVLKTEQVAEGTVPSYDGTPEKEADAQYTYTFAGWDPTPVAVTSDAVYTATYTKEVKSYTITWMNEGEVFDTTTVAYGETPADPAEVPTKAADAQSTYTFEDWTPARVPVTGDATYTATYKEAARTYTITWMNEGEVFDTTTVAYGETPADPAEKPKKAPDAQSTYTFEDWTPARVPVTGDATYTATYTSEPRGMYIWLHEFDDDKIVKYTVNQLDDLDENLKNGDVSDSSKLVVGGKFYLPATQEADYWMLKINGTAKEFNPEYQPGSVYLIDSADRSNDGIIHFYATATEEPTPEEQQVISIFASGYYASGSDANAAMTAVTQATSRDGTGSVTDCADKTMYVFWTNTVASHFTVTLSVGDETITLSDADRSTSNHRTYWTFDESHANYVGVPYQAGKVYTVTVTDTVNSVSESIVLVGTEQTVPTPTPSTETTYTVFYVVDGAVVDSATQTLKAGDALVFPTVEGKTIAWSGVESTTGLTATADAVYIGTTETETPTYSADAAVSAKYDDGKVRFVIAGYDGGDIKGGTVTISYSFKADGSSRVRTGDPITADVVYDGGVAYGVVDIPAGQNAVRFTATYTYELDGQSYSVSSSIVYVGA